MMKSGGTGFLSGEAAGFFGSLYAQAGQHKTVSDPTLEANKEGSTILDQITNLITKRVTFRVSKPIRINKSSFSSYLKLASTIGHELKHVANVLNGNMVKWYAKGGEDYRYAMSEYASYNWEDNIGGDSNRRAINQFNSTIINFKFK